MSKQRQRRLYNRWTPFLLILPALLVMAVIHFMPSIIGIIISFRDFTASSLRDWTQSAFVGLQNYREVFSWGKQFGTEFLLSAKATLMFTFFSLLGIYTLGLIAALSLYGDSKLRRLLRGLFLLPWVLPEIVAIFIWKSMFFRDFGPINKILQGLRIINEPMYWLIGNTAIWPVIIANVWKAWPFAFITLLAGLQGIPTELYDAADVDGASYLKRTWYITLPMIFPVTRVLVLLLMIWTALNFTVVYIFYGYAPPRTANVLSVHVYNTAFQQWDFGRGAAMSVILMVGMAMVCVAYVRYFVESSKRGKVN